MILGLKGLRNFKDMTTPHRNTFNSFQKNGYPICFYAQTTTLEPNTAAKIGKLEVKDLMPYFIYYQNQTCVCENKLCNCSEDFPVPPAVMILHNKKSRACAVVVRATRSVESPLVLYGGIIKVEIFSVFFFDERKPSSHPEEQ